MLSRIKDIQDGIIDFSMYLCQIWIFFRFLKRGPSKSFVTNRRNLFWVALRKGHQCITCFQVDINGLFATSWRWKKSDYLTLVVYPTHKAIALLFLGVCEKLRVWQGLIFFPALDFWLIISKVLFHPWENLCPYLAYFFISKWRRSLTLLVG